MIKSLTGLRFVFAFMVFLLHIVNSSMARYFDNPARWLAVNVFKEGYIGVSFFFMLSGFILTYSYKEKFRNKLVTKRKFWVARLARIYPLHIYTLVISIPLVEILMNGSLQGLGFAFFLNVFLLHSFILPPSASAWFWSFNTVSWSISTEAFFYFLFPFIIYFLLSYRKQFFLIVLLLCFMLPILMCFVSSGIRSEWFYINPFARIFDFLIGTILFELYNRVKDAPYVKRYGTLLEIFSLLLFFTFFLFHQNVDNVYRYSCYYWIPIATIILFFAFQKGQLSLFLSNRYAVYLGEISFGFYMFHALIIEYSIRLFDWRLIFGNYYVFVLFLFIFTILISAISFHLFEKPINKFIIKKFG